MKTILILLGVFTFGVKVYAQNQTCKEVVGYYPNWQWYDRNKLVNPQSINYSKYTIINYAFLKPESDGSISLFDPWADENLLLGQPDWNNGGYIPNTSLIDIAHANGVKVLPSIGGWTLSNDFPAIAADPTKRANFVNSCINLINTYAFDGIDLDWEYPGFPDHNGTLQDKQNFTLLLQDLRAALDALEAQNSHNYLLTAAVGAAADRMDDVDWPAVSQSLDIINLMSYDFFGTWDVVSNHNSPLYAPAQGDTSFNINSSAMRLINDYGVDPAKITIGVPFYGRTSKTVGVPCLHCPINGQADNVTFSADAGTPLYYNIQKDMHLFDAYWDSQAKVPYLLGKNGLNTFVSYENKTSIAEKAKFIVDHNFGGAIIWEITGDYVETSPGSGVIQGTPLTDTLNHIFCNYSGDNNPPNQIDENEIEFSLFPNPANEKVVISVSDLGVYSYQLLSIDGKLIDEGVLNNYENVLFTFGLNAGAYHLVISGNGKKASQKLIKL